MQYSPVKPQAESPEAPPPEELYRLYGELSPAAKVVVHLKIVAGSGAGNGTLYKAVSAVKIPLPGGKTLGAGFVGEVVSQVKGSGLWLGLNQERNQFCHDMNIAAFADPMCGLYIEAVERTSRSTSYVHYQAHRIRELRFVVYGNYDDAMAGRLVEDTPGTLALLAGFVSDVTLRPEWLSSRAPVIREALLLAKLDFLLRTGHRPPDFDGFRTQLEQLAATSQDPGTRISLARFAILRGEPAGAIQIGEDLRPRTREIEGGKASDHGVMVAAYRHLIAAMAHFTCGRNTEALAGFREGLKLFRKSTHKRKIFLPDIEGLLAMLCILREGDSALIPELMGWVEDAGRDTFGSSNLGGVDAAWAMALIVQGKDDAAGNVLKNSALNYNAPLARAVEPLAQFLLDPTPLRARMAELKSLFERYRDTLPLIAEIYASLLEKLANDPEPYREFLGRPGRQPIIRLVDLIKVNDPWERALDHLETLLAPSANPVAEPARKKSKRLIWLLEPDIGTIEVVEQTAKVKEGWNAGRTLSFRRVGKNEPPLEMDDHDRRVVATLRHGYDRTPYYYTAMESYGPDPYKTLLALVGHPRVFHAEDRSRQLDLVRYPVELVVSEAPGGYRIALSHFSEQPATLLEQEAPDRYRVIDVSADVVKVGSLLGSDGMVVPRDGRDRVVNLVRRSIGGALPIRSEIDAVEVPAIEGDPTPVLRLVPIDRGLRVSAFVLPFGDAGPHYLPGHAGKSVLSLVDGKTQRANRDLERETAELTALLAACPSLDERAVGEMEWALPDLYDSLEFLSEVQGYPGAVSLEWPEGGRLQVTAAAASAGMSVKLRASRDWFQVSGEVRIDENLVMDLRELLDRAARTQGRFIQLDDGRFLALTEELRRRLDRLGALSEGDGRGRKVHRMAAFAVAEALEDAGKLDADKQWRDQLERIRAAGSHAPKIPSTLQTDLRDYQAEGFRWMSRLAHWGAGACLADDMGLGKTVQAIAVMLEHAPHGAILVVAPTSVCHNWAAEIERFAPSLFVHQFAAVGDRTALVKSLGPMDVLVTSYGLLHQEAALLSATPWRIAVLDEAQAIKNAATKRAQASMMLQADFRLALTGTPVENYLEELWSLFHFINPGLLGSLESFRKRFALPIERGDKSAKQSLKALVGPFILRRTKSAVLTELPPRTEQTILVDLDDDERALYEALRRRAMERIENLPDDASGQRKIHILAEITRLRRACCHPSLAAPDATGMEGAKLSLFLELVDELVRNRHKALVFSQYVGFLEIVRKALDERGIAYQYLDGQTPQREREKRVNAFQAGEGDLFVISLKAGGTGLNLTAADYVIHLDPWWNPAVEDQASGRAHRIGQQRPVTVYRLAVAGTIEQGILGLHQDKREMAAELLDGSEASAKLSDEELMNLLSG
ncbi:DEAD/DEAH box helicase [Skermanella mucosa]|uniref:DEAD/DEAH box helicase n=1 Tax=Skermanella mucosa TaxID=1789672 RepID=UPI00192A827B|nr:DEAD/DEAH box helicase [Skermanella mucosa]UEM23376.1 DEAD/DEAH box helicase [Skermanella mucosa]